MKSKDKLREVFTFFSQGLKKRGQLTLFVIIAIVIVLVIMVYIYYIGPTYVGTGSKGLSFDDCVRDATEQTLVDLSLTGGDKNPGFYFLYEDNKLPYFCYTNVAYKTCVVQRPMVKQFFEEQLILSLKEKANLCYENSVEDLKEQGYLVRAGRVDMNLTIIPERINVDIFAPTTVGGQRFTNYRMYVDSNIYDVLMVVTSILQYESSYGDAPTSELMFYYPELIIDKFKQGDSTTVYVVTDKASDIKFQFVSRSLIWPAGYDILEYGKEK